VAIHTPAELADLFASARELTDTERAVLAADFLRIRGETGLLRRWEEGRILGVPTERYNPLLLALAIAGFPPPPGLEIVLLILPACAPLVYLRVPVYLRWRAESSKGHTLRVARDGFLGGGAIALLSLFNLEGVASLQMSQILGAQKSVDRHPHADVNAAATAGGGKGLPPYELKTRRSEAEPR
jgi:hypothetical protein